MSTAVLACAVVIEDDEDIRALEAAILQGDGWAVETACTGAEGVAVVRATVPDVVVCDLMLPDIDGFAIIRALQDDPATADIPVILVSAMGDEKNVVTGIDTGALDYITKPFAPVQLQLRCRAALRVRQNYLSLRSTQDELRLLFEEAPIGKALVSPDGRFLRVNEALCHIVGYTEDELLRVDFQDITHPDDLAGDVELVQQVLDGVIPRYTLEKRYLRHDGTIADVQLDVTLVRDRAGSPLHFIAQIQDISERKAVTESLLETQAIQRASLDSLEQGVSLVATGGKVKLLNKAAERILGYNLEELTERFASGEWNTYCEDGSIMPFEDRPLTHTMLTGDGVSDRVVCWYTKAGDFVTLRIATEPIHDADGNVTASVVAFADITAQRKVEQERQAAVEQLEWEASHDALTGLANRAKLLEHLRTRLTDDAAGATALLYVDLDHFKAVNDTMGHDVGDELLVVVARRLEQAIRPTDLVARYGGDEFLVVVAVEGDDDAETIAARILERLGAPVALSTGELRTSASIGLAHADDLDLDGLIRDADTALFRAKHEGRNRVAHVVPRGAVPA